MSSNNRKPTGFVVPPSSPRTGLGSENSSFINQNKHSRVPFNVGFNRGTSASDFARSFSRGMINADLNLNFNYNAGDRGSKTKLNSSRNSNNTNGNGSGKPPGRGRESRLGNNSRRYDWYQERNSAQISWSPGLASGTISNSRVLGDRAHSPIFILAGQLIPDRSENNSYLQSLFDESLYYKYLRHIDTKLNRSVAKQFKKEVFYDYFQVVSKALQIYYCIDSILTYSKKSTNNNFGINVMRNRITAKNLSDFQRLQLTLEGLPCPRRLVDFIRYHYQNFAFSDVKNSPIYRLSYQGLFYQINEGIVKGSIESNIINETINELNDSKFQDIICIYLRAFSDHKINDMPPSCEDVIVSDSFKTFWHNSNVYFTDYNVVIPSCTVDSDDENMYYASFTDEIDGAIFALGSTELNNVCEPGFFRPYSNFDGLEAVDCTSIHRVSNGEITGCSDTFIAAACGLYIVPILDDGDVEIQYTVGTYPQPGTQRMSSVDLDSQKASAQLLADYIFDPFQILRSKGE